MCLHMKVRHGASRFGPCPAVLPQLPAPAAWEVPAQVAEQLLIAASSRPLHFSERGASFCSGPESPLLSPPNPSCVPGSAQKLPPLKTPLSGDRTAFLSPLHLAHAFSSKQSARSSLSSWMGSFFETLHGQCESRAKPGE